MNRAQEAKQYLEERFRREGVVVGTPEGLAHDAGFTTREMEEALTSLVAENKVRPFQDDEGTLEYQWHSSP